MSTCSIIAPSEARGERLVFIDCEDRDYLAEFGSWYNNGTYPQIIDKSINPNRTILMHRVIWEKHNGPVPEKRFIDHIDRNGFNNQKSNLRLVTAAQNAVNSSTKRTNRSGLKGVHLDKRRGSYQAMMRINGRLEHIGMFSDPQEAAFAFDYVAKRLHGEYAAINGAPFSASALAVVRDNARLMSFIEPLS